jgi:D-arabinose 1-dehydrogenase-like Zn-dependent alcohol dehydrogenase
LSDFLANGPAQAPIERGEDMHALVLEEFNGPFIPKEVATPRISSHEALVRVRNVGVCGTDLKIRAGRMGLNVLPLIMGHEVAGEVAEVGSVVQGVAPGDRVTVNFYMTCGHLSVLP